ncbi:MAG: efflux RND transporter permease subunit [Pseudomonadota bacterium]
MSITKTCLKNPAAIAVMLALVALLGTLSIQRLPVQLFPNIERPMIGVWTGWRAASPREVEAEIVEPIERELRGISGLQTMQSWSNNGGGFVSLEFALGTDMDSAFTEVTSRLQRVRGLPADADRPRVQNNGGGDSGETLIYLFLQKLPGNVTDDFGMVKFAESRIRPMLESIDGVGGVDINSDKGEEIIRVEFDPFLLADRGISIEQIAQTINRSSDVSGGTVEVGRRNYNLRFEGRFSADDLAAMTIAWVNDAPILLGDLAEIHVGPNPRNVGVVYQNGNPAIGMRIIREPGANTLATIDALTVELDALNEGILANMGYSIQKSFDPSVFINRAISLLTGNLLIGILLAIAALWLFLRQSRATLLIASAIPVSLLATLIVLNMTGRSINVISLAGLAFATGMVLDAAIVVLENFVRLREKGQAPEAAANKSVEQVFGALFASTVTTVAVFMPVIFFEDVEGQLFADLALTIAIAVVFSLMIAITVLPTGAVYFLKDVSPRKGARSNTHDGDAEKSKPDWTIRLTNFIMMLTGTWRRQLAWCVALIAVPIAAGWLLWPQLNYLPPVKRDAVDGFISFPSGANANLVRDEFAEIVVDRLQPFMDGDREPALRNYYLFSGPWGANIGVRAKDQSKVDELADIINEEIISGFPDTRAFAQQGDLFGQFGGGASIRIDLQASDFDALGDAVPNVTDIIQSAIPDTNVWANPDPQIVTPEISLIPNDRRIAEVGMTRDGVARAMRAMGDGLWLGEFFHQGERIDIFLEARDWTAPEFIEQTPIITPSGALVPLGELATAQRSVGPQQIRRYDGRRTISLAINAPDELALGEVMATLKEKAEADIYAALPADATVQYKGEADALARAVRNLGGNFALAILILFLILAALFKSVRDAGIVIVCLPMAAVGGVLALRGLNLISPTPLDLLGMIGFIILLGLVVNNAILLVAQTRASQADGHDRASAVREALTRRVRPIFMSTSTSLMGMLPLVVTPGAGSMIYRGLSTVIVGGMAVSTLFTLILLPALLQLSGRASTRMPSQSLSTGPAAMPTSLQPAE